MSLIDVISVSIGGDTRPVIQVDTDRKEVVWRRPCSDQELAFCLTNRTTPITNSEVALCLAYGVTSQQERLAALEKELAALQARVHDVEGDDR
jgi:hypothetical protein